MKKTSKKKPRKAKRRKRIDVLANYRSPGDQRITKKAMAKFKQCPPLQVLSDETIGSTKTLDVKVAESVASQAFRICARLANDDRFLSDLRNPEGPRRIFYDLFSLGQEKSHELKKFHEKIKRLGIDDTQLSLGEINVDNLLHTHEQKVAMAQEVKKWVDVLAKIDEAVYKGTLSIHSMQVIKSLSDARHALYGYRDLIEDYSSASAQSAAA